MADRLLNGSGHSSVFGGRGRCGSSSWVHGDGWRHGHMGAENRRPESGHVGDHSFLPSSNVAVTGMRALDSSVGVGQH